MHILLFAKERLFVTKWYKKYSSRAGTSTFLLDPESCQGAQNYSTPVPGTKLFGRGIRLPADAPGYTQYLCNRWLAVLTDAPNDNGVRCGMNRKILIQLIHLPLLFLF
jgi:hypothetical protein